MVTALKFIASYLSALAATMFVLTMIGFFVFGNETLSAALGEYMAVLIGVALFSLPPAILFVWSHTRLEGRLNGLRFGMYGLMTAFVESSIVIWFAFNGDLATGFGYIVSLSLAGFIGGVTISIVWNRLTKAIPAPNR
ncbi:MAG: hypothetical protein AAF996_00325 [Pseudomonadota bacterium]